MRALISVSNKEGIVRFATELEKLGFEIVSTGGTYKILKENNLNVIAIDDVTQFPEMLDGRVKTLHPKIHGGLLALRDNPDHVATCKEHDISFIDLVVVNLYPFEKTISKASATLEEAIENIDIGGPSMIRSAAKNYRSVGVVVDPSRYDQIIDNLKSNKGQLTAKVKAELAAEAFSHTARYDTMITNYLSTTITHSENSDGFPQTLAPIYNKAATLRYGENPHQQAAFYEPARPEGLSGLNQLHGKELSYNNIVDLEAAWQISRAFELPAAAIIKHTNPCGAAVGDSLREAYLKAYEADPISAFGSIIGLNRPVDKATAEEVSKLFVEAVVAPGFEQDALEILTQKPSIRLVVLNDFNTFKEPFVFKYVNGGFLLQTPDAKAIRQDDLKVVTKRQPNQKEINDLLFGFSVVKFVKSNAIVLAKDGQIIGVGAGQMSRIDSVRIAIEKAGDKAKGAVLASDAFFPFKDSVEFAAQHGITSVIQPGGSKRDQESIDFCDENNLSMVVTGVRHFRH